MVVGWKKSKARMALRCHFGSSPWGFSPSSRRGRRLTSQTFHQHVCPKGLSDGYVSSWHVCSSDDARVPRSPAPWCASAVLVVRTLQGDPDHCPGSGSGRTTALRHLRCNTRDIGGHTRVARKSPSRYMRPAAGDCGVRPQVQAGGMPGASADSPNSATAADRGPPAADHAAADRDLAPAGQDCGDGNCLCCGRGTGPRFHSGRLGKALWRGPVKTSFLQLQMPQVMMMMPQPQMPAQEVSDSDTEEIHS